MPSPAKNIKSWQERLPLIAAEYERLVREAEDAHPREELTEAHRMAAAFFQSSLPPFITRGAIDPLTHQSLLAIAQAQLAATLAMQGRKDSAPVAAVARRMVAEADSQRFRSSKMRARGVFGDAVRFGWPLV